MMAVISKAVFEKMTKTAAVGDVLAIDRYTTSNPALESLGDEGARLFLFTVRPPDEQLWLVAVLSGLSHDGESWVGEPNSTPITDVGPIKSEIQFASGVGIKAKPGALGMSLQTPRPLTEGDVALLLGAASGEPPPPRATNQEADSDAGDDDGDADEAPAPKAAPAKKAAPKAKAKAKPAAKKPAAKKPAPKAKKSAPKPAGKPAKRMASTDHSEEE